MWVHIEEGSFALTPFTFDAHTNASEIRLVGGAQTEIRLDERDSNADLFTIREGAPPIYLEGLALSSSFRVEGGQLRLSRCILGGARPLQQGRRRLAGSESPSRILVLSGGDTTIANATFSDSAGGAIAVTRTAALDVTNSIFRNNSADSGGAMLVSGGRVVLSRCLFEGNQAAGAGGALRMSGGATLVELRDQTVLRGNEANEGRSISFTSGSLSYALPAPLGHYVFVIGSTSAAFLTSSIDVDFPFPCPGGVLGDSYVALEQSGPWCSGVCPAGFACKAGSVVPEICPRGRFCPESSASGQVCHAGTWSNRTGLASASECSACPPGKQPTVTFLNQSTCAHVLNPCCLLSLPYVAKGTGAAPVRRCRVRAASSASIPTPGTRAPAGFARSTRLRPAPLGSFSNAVRPQ